MVRVGSRTAIVLEHRLHAMGHEIAYRVRRAPAWCRRALHVTARVAAIAARRLRVSARIRARALAVSARASARALAPHVARALHEILRQIGLLPGRVRRLPREARVTLWIALIAVVGYWEIQTSSLQARVLSAFASTLTYSVERGPSPRIVFPREGPWDERRGYTRVAEFSRRLERKGYRLVSQARFSPPLALAARSGVTPPEPEPSEVGLVIQGSDGDTLYDAVRGASQFQRFDEIPPLVVQSLLFVENRELARRRGGTVNPAVDWGRFCKAFLLYVGRHAGLPLPSEGGSTLAVQLEKYRHSPEGRTGSAPEKLRQMLTASLRAYKAGPRTGEARRQIILDYVNSVPLGGVPGYGEVLGLPEGLEVWFGLEPREVSRALLEPTDPGHIPALKAVLALLCAVRAPTYYLIRRNDALEARVASYTKLLTTAGVLDAATAAEIRATPIPSRRGPRPAWVNSVRIDQGTGRVREELRELLGVRDNYALDRIHVTVDATIDPGLQRDVSTFFRELAEADTLAARGLTGERLLGESDPAPVFYSLLVCERTPAGNFVRVEEDNVPGALDFNRGTMLELGSTAKLRTLVHYLDVVAREHEGLAGQDAEDLEEQAAAARDPITRWLARTMAQEPDAPLDSLLQWALEREYSASPGEVFFTGGGRTTFRNFDSDDDDQRFTVREAAVRSNNLTFIRLMRDLVAYHAARLPYDAAGTLSGNAKSERERLLREIAEEEGEMPDTSWLLRTTSRRAQDLRLRARIERDAFARMSEDWRRIGFPFPQLVPSYATAIGSSADQPGALADLMAVLVNDGYPLPTRRIRRVVFAPGTPYETTYEAPPAPSGVRVLDPRVARAVRGVLADVVDRGTGRRMRGAFVDSSDVAVEIGGKTGTGDNRVERYGRGGRVISSRAVSRTATFVFYLQDRYYGVITASVLGPNAASYHFTSALPVSILRQLAPKLEGRLHLEPIPLKTSVVEGSAVPTAAPG